MSQSFSPLKQSERIVLIDMLRGLAIFGILMVNMQIFYLPVSHMVAGPQLHDSFINLLSEWFIKFFFEGKFYVLFSLLFGYGFWIFMNKKSAEGSSIIPVYLRRIFFLMLFGMAHVVLLWAGDILVFYALFGFILILFRKSRNRILIKWAVVLVLIPIVLTGLSAGLMNLLMKVPEANEAINASLLQSAEYTNQIIEKAMVVYSSGNFSEIVSIRLTEYRLLLPGLLFFYPVVLALFLMGVVIARKGLIANYTENLPVFRKMFWWGLPVGIVTNIVFVLSYRNSTISVPDGWTFLVTSMHIIGGIALCMVYVSSLIMLYAKGLTHFFENNLAPVGRMALTNYLLHSIICAVFFHSYGFALFGKVEVWQGIMLTIVIFSLQIPFSRWWLSRYQFGPFEWLWRTLTYLKLQPFIRK